LTLKIKTRQIEHSEFIRLLCGDYLFPLGNVLNLHCDSVSSMNQGLSDRQDFPLVIQFEDLATIPSLHEVFKSVFVRDPFRSYFRVLAMTCCVSICEHPLFEPSLRVRGISRPIHTEPP